MLIIVGSGLFAAGVVLMMGKLSASLGNVLRLADELDPLRPSAPGFKLPSRKDIKLDPRTVAPCSESMLRLSAAVAGTKEVHGDSEPAEVLPEVPAA
jgi:hypothetical protein